jgi:hypothetical protein
MGKATWPMRGASRMSVYEEDGRDHLKQELSIWEMRLSQPIPTVFSGHGEVNSGDEYDPCVDCLEFVCCDLGQ